MRALFKELDLSVIRCLMDTNFYGTVYCTKYALPYLLEAKVVLLVLSQLLVLWDFLPEQAILLQNSP